MNKVYYCQELDHLITWNGMDQIWHTNSLNIIETNFNCNIDNLINYLLIRYQKFPLVSYKYDFIGWLD